MNMATRADKELTSTKRKRLSAPNRARDMRSFARGMRSFPLPKFKFCDNCQWFLRVLASDFSYFYYELNIINRLQLLTEMTDSL
jgi:hypothetical protein